MSSNIIFKKYAQILYQRYRQIMLSWC